MTPLTPYLAGGALLGVVVVGGAGFFFGKDVQRDRDTVELSKERNQRQEASRSDERLLATMSGTFGNALTAALNNGDRQAAPIILGMHDAIRATPLATDTRCAVPDSVRIDTQALHRAAERAADLADSSGTALVGGAQPVSAR